ncbi:MAG: 30S ribosomal protein S15 [Cytophagales bacterium]|nr:30S ribosomal protein S15 [Cytophagales bacterium]
MYLTQEKKQKLFKTYSPGKSVTDTGAPESQIALYTERINHLTAHLNSNKKDFSTKAGLLKLVGKRRRMLDYLQHTNLTGYRDLIAKLNIRK